MFVYQLLKKKLKDRFLSIQVFKKKIPRYGMAFKKCTVKISGPQVIHSDFLLNLFSHLGGVDLQNSWAY